MFTATRGATRRLLTIGMATALALATSVTSVMAWTPPTLEALCAPDENSYSWRISLTTEPDYWIELSWNADFSDDWDVDFGSAGQHEFDTPRGGSVLYARWKNDKAKKTSAQANAQLCEQPEPDDDASLNIKKEDENGKGLPGGVFTVEGMEGTFVTDEDGFFCITGLPQDSVWLVTEIQAPEGYQIADPASQMVEVDNDGDCNSPDARFVNLPIEVEEPPVEEPPVEEPPVEEPPVEEPDEDTEPDQDVKGDTGTPAPELPNTALGMSSGQLAWSMPLGILLFGLSLATVAVRANRGNRR